MAVVVGGIGALVWSLRKRVRVAVGWGEESDPCFNIIDPVNEDAGEKGPEDPGSDMGTDPGDTSPADEEPPRPADAADGAG